MGQLQDDAENRRPKRRVLDLGGQNHASVAAWVRIAELELLLGADLETTNEATTGWDGVLGLTSPPWRSAASAYKVSHHGSVTGDHAGVWARLVSPDATALVTPFTRQRLPSSTDRERIRNSVASAYLTSPPDASRRIRRAPEVEKLLRGRASRVRAPGAFGHIRLRRDVASAQWSVETHGAASRL